MRKKNNKSRIAFWTLGCSKNTYDSEQLMNQIHQKGYEVVDLKDKPDAVILNTCGFIEEAKEQSIEAILQACEWKKTANVEKVVAMGCLTQRYREEITTNIPELDGVFGVNEFDAMLGFCEKELVAVPGDCTSDIDHLLTLCPGHWTYLKVSDGCSNGCTFCAIPGMKGLLKDREEVDILEEVKRKVARGVKEFNIIGQDPTHFGEDATGEKFLRLLEKICAIEGDFWVRVLYAYPGHLHMGVIDFIASNPKMVNYIDMPIQHANTFMLKKMGRFHTQKKIMELIKHAWNQKERVHLRSTAIVGFPGETDEHFEDMLQFICDNKFDRLGAFAYSAEDGTPAANFKDHVDADVVTERLNRFQEVQAQIAETLALARVGTIEKVLVDAERKDLGEGYYEVRTQAEAPEVDPIVIMKGEGVVVGNWCMAKITGYENGELLSEKVG